jgi:hypothetical protein
MELTILSVRLLTKSPICQHFQRSYLENIFEILIFIGFLISINFKTKQNEQTRFN